MKTRFLTGACLALILSIFMFGCTWGDEDEKDEPNNPIIGTINAEVQVSGVVVPFTGTDITTGEVLRFRFSEAIADVALEITVEDVDGSSTTRNVVNTYTIPTVSSVGDRIQIVATLQSGSLITRTFNFVVVEELIPEFSIRAVDGVRADLTDDDVTLKFEVARTDTLGKRIDDDDFVWNPGNKNGNTFSLELKAADHSEDTTVDVVLTYGEIEKKVTVTVIAE